MKKRVVLDVDVGIDDALAILYLAAQSQVDLVAVGSVHGNVDAPRAALNALRVLELVGSTDVPVAQGATEPLGQPVATSWIVHGTDGLGNTYSPAPHGAVTGEHAADQIVRLGHEMPGELDLVAVGPLTNLAMAIDRDPEALHRYKSVVVLGGSGCEPPEWHRLTVDANIASDPEAADLVFSTTNNCTMVGVDLEPFLILGEPGVEQLEQAEQAHSEFVWDMLQQYLDFIESVMGRRVVTLWDPLAAAVLVDPSLVEASTMGVVDVVPSPEGFRAMCLRDRRATGRFDVRPEVRIINTVAADRFVDGFLAALTGPIGNSSSDV